MSEMAVTTENLVKTYNTSKVKTLALRGVNLEMPRGSFCCIVGPSGHGKSTLLHLMGGLDRPTEGVVRIGGLDISRLNNRALAELRAERVGFVFQFFNLLQSLTVLENVEAAVMFSKHRKSIAWKERAKEVLSQVGLSEKLNAKPSDLSGGQQQRVAVARALVNDPELLLMDEPTGNLDSESEKELLDHVFRLHREGKTVALVTHNSEIAKRAEVVFEIRDGRLRVR